MLSILPPCCFACLILFVFLRSCYVKYLFKLNYMAIYLYIQLLLLEILSITTDICITSMHSQPLKFTVKYKIEKNVIRKQSSQNLQKVYGGGRGQFRDQAAFFYWIEEVTVLFNSSKSTIFVQHWYVSQTSLVLEIPWVWSSKRLSIRLGIAMQALLLVICNDRST
jgi:hypothetical protein